METQTSVARGATSLYIANIVVLVANTLYFLVLTNILRSTLDVGIVTALNLTIWLLVTVCVLAQPVTAQSPIPAPLAVLKFLPELLARKAGLGAVKVFRNSLAFAVVIGGVVATILAISPGLVIQLIGGREVLPAYVQLSAVDIFVLSLGQVCVAALIALADMKSATAYIIAWSIARYALASLLLLTYGIVGILVGWIIGDAVLLILALQKSVRALRVERGGSDFSLGEVLRYSLYTLLSALIGFAINQADKVFTLAQQGLRELAIYNVAIVAASFAGFAPYALITVLLPALSALRASGKAGEVREMIRAYSRYISIVVIPIAFGFASITEVALRIFGPEYLGGFLPSVIVSVATGLTAVGAVYAAVLLAIGELKWYTLANVLGLGSLMVVAYLATPVLGLNGPALGRASLMALTAVVYAFAARRSGFFELDLRALASATGGSFMMGGIVYLVLSFFNSFLAKLAMLPIAVVVGALIYFGSLRALHLLTIDDVEFVQGIVPSKLRRFIPKIAGLAGVRARK